MAGVSDEALCQFERRARLWAKKYGWTIGDVRRGYGLFVPSVVITGLLPGHEDLPGNYHRVEYDAAVMGQDIDMVMESFIAKLRAEKKKREADEDD
jgi:hypothetical protein